MTAEVNNMHVVRTSNAGGRLAAGAALAGSAQAALGQSDRLLVAQHIPQAIARQQQQLIVWPPGDDRHLHGQRQVS